jgi:nucleoid-associated protein YgaU
MATYKSLVNRESPQEWDSPGWSLEVANLIVNNARARVSPVAFFGAKHHATSTTVSRGDSLWRLSRLRYGVGTRYAVIYKTNREQIRNPNLIHPGQIFVLPARAKQ